MDFINYMLVGIGLLNFFLLAIIHLRSPNISSVKYLKVAVLGICLWCTSMILFRASPNVQMAVFWAKLLYCSAAFIPMGYLLHGVSFPNRTVDKRLTLFVISFFLLLDVLILFTSTVIAGVDLNATTREKPIQFGFAYYSIYIGYISLFFTLAYLEYYKRLQVAKGLYKYQLRVILFGIIAASTVGMITNLILPTFGNFSFNWLGQVMTTLWLVVVTYGIIRHRLLDVKLLIVRSLSYFLVLVMVIAFFVLVVITANSIMFQAEYSMGEVAIFLLGFIFLITFYQPLKKGFDSLTASIFYKGNYDSREFLNSLNVAIASHLELADISKQLFKQLSEFLKVTNVDLVVFEEGRAYFSASSNRSEKIKINPEEIALLKRATNTEEKILIFDEMDEGKNKSLMREKEYQIVLPFILRDELVGGMFIGEKASGSYYSSEDIQMFKIIAPELAIVAKNALSFEEIKQFTVTLKEEVDRATKKLSSANHRLLELDKLKDEFVSLASHELRTPMVSIRNYIWMVLNGKGGKVNPKQKEYLRRAYDSTSRLSRLVNSMLNLSRIESGRVILSAQQADIRTVVRDVITEIGLRADKMGIKLAQRQKVVSAKTGETVQLPAVVIDIDKIKEVMINLIGNSLKFTPAGGSIAISFSVDKDFVYVDISDSGVGLDAEQIPLLFKKFSMLRESYSTNATMAQGTGLGLYICKSIIEMHGGKIWVESEGKGKGSTFRFTLPRYSQAELQKLMHNQHEGTDAGIIHSAVTDY